MLIFGSHKYKRETLMNIGMQLRSSLQTIDTSDFSSTKDIIEPELILNNSTEPDECEYYFISDDEPDDEESYTNIASYFSEKKIRIGTTGMHAGRKRAIVRKIFDILNLPMVPVYQGTGGTKDSYRDVDSTRAAKTYLDEGIDVLTKDELNEANNLPRSSNELSEKIEETLSQAKDHSVIFAVLAPPTDLMKVLSKSSHLTKKIKHIHIMGGWRARDENGKRICRTTYNWDMDPESSAELMKIKDVAMTLYSSHTFLNSFKLGIINSDTMPNLIDHKMKYRSLLPSLDISMRSSYNWSKHVIKAIPNLKNIIEPFQDHQTTPADSAVVIGMINEKLIVSKRKVNISIDLKDMTNKGFRVDVEDNPDSNITLVDKIDSKIYEDGMILAYKRLLNKHQK